jgi:hypothetical protein
MKAIGSWLMALSIFSRLNSNMRLGVGLVRQELV